MEREWRGQKGRGEGKESVTIVPVLRNDHWSTLRNLEFLRVDVCPETRTVLYSQSSLTTHN